MQNAFHLLENAISKRHSGLLNELALLSSVKELLEGELGSSNLQREMVTIIAVFVFIIIVVY